MIKNIATLLLLNSIVFAQATEEEVKSILNNNVYEPNYFSMILGLFVVVAMIYATGFIYQKMAKFNTLSKDVYINRAQVISTTSLGQGRNLHVVKIGNTACLLGSTQNNITYIKDVEIVEADEKESVKNDKNC
ncbi:FliO/MopB family protein [bacterium]|nr:FliO/MopB family protein [bacterium]